MPPVKSKPITIDDANVMCLNLQALKSSCSAKLDAALARDTEAKRYFRGDEIAFFFNKASIERLWNVIKDPAFPDDESGFALFTAVRKDDKLNILGRPSLIAFAYKTVDNGGKERDIQILGKNGSEIKFDDTSKKFKITSGQFDSDGDGEEHPGGGSGSPLIGLPVTIPGPSVQSIL